MSKSEKALNIRACRICRDSNCTDVIILDEQNGWLQQFQYCFGISLSIQDKPRSLCKQCADQVRNYSKFKDLCYTSDRHWRSPSSVKCIAENLRPNKVIKDELFDNDQNSSKSDIEPNYICINQCDSDLTNLYNKTHNFVGIENFGKETLPNEISSNMIGNKKRNDLLVENVYMKHSSKPCKKETFIEKTKSKVVKKDLLRGKRLSTCKLCQKSYGSKLWYLKHLKSCKLKKIKQSTNRNQGLENILQNNNEIMKSCENTEPKQDLFKFCGVCKFSANNVDDVAKHLDSHWTNNDLQCALCEYVGKDQAALAAHRYNHNIGKTCSFLCHICKKKTRSQLTLQFHYRKIHLNKVGGLCSQPQCDKAYDSWKLWKRHEKLHTHPGYICDFCGQKFKHKHVIVEHLSIHVNPTTHVCDVCGRTFLRLRNLRVHIENVHVKSDPLKCFHCNRMFKNQHYLRIHQKLLAKEKVWKCEFCPLEYPNLSSLKSHLKSHSEERPHSCHVCGSRYKAKCQLAIHIRNHTGDRPYKCVVCDKAFKSTQLLRRHTMMHTGLKPHKCLHCEKTFICRKRMLKHCTMRHNDKITESK